MSEESTDQSAQRRTKLAELRARGQAYPNDFRRDAEAGALHERFAGTDAEALEREPVAVAVAGRMMTCRIMGKASFAHLRDGTGDIQIYLRRDDLPEGQYAGFKRFDLGDIVAVEGTVFRTKTGELSVKARSVRLLVKSLLPLPEKYHGLADVETRYRRRYVDLIVNDRSREVFRARSRTVDYIRRFFLDRGFLEVETPMMHPDPRRGGGPALRDPPQRARHGPLPSRHPGAVPQAARGRRIRAGVRDHNRNFRNEGVSTRHNPEFTMLEFYQAYEDYYLCTEIMTVSGSMGMVASNSDGVSRPALTGQNQSIKTTVQRYYVEMMDLTEALVRGAALAVCGTAGIEYQGESIDLGAPFRRLSMEEAILDRNPGLDAAGLRRDETVRGFARSLGVAVEPHHGRGKL